MSLSSSLNEVCARPTCTGQLAKLQQKAGAVPEEVRLLKDFLHEIHGYLSSEMGWQLVKELSLLPICMPHPHFCIVVPASRLYY